MDHSIKGISRFRLPAVILAMFFFILPGRAVQAATIDIMLVYDTTATTWVSSKGGMTAFSEDVVNRMNQAMQNSGVATTFRLVHAMPVSYTTKSSQSTPLSADLQALQTGSGAFAAVHTARNTYGADLVAMLVDHGSAYGYVGQGYMLTDWSGNDDYGFTVNAIRSVEISHTLTHEVGHNLGADHAKNQYSDPGPNQYLDNQYSAGWYFTGTNGTKYHTIMAYNDDGYGGRYDPAPLFSTPLKTYQGVPAGHAQNGDNTRLLGQTQDIVAAYRSASATVPSAPVATAASGISNTGFTANWNSVSGATGYWLEVSTNSTFAQIAGVWEYDENVGNVTSRQLSSLTPNTTYYYRVRAYNASDTSAYSNIISATTTGGATSQPDLVITTVTSPATGSLGGEIQASATVKNQGSVTADESLLLFYFSTDSTITLADVTDGWGGCYIPALAAGATYTCDSQFPIPTTLTAGTYYLGAYADSHETVSESSETNNGRAATNSILISGGTGGGPLSDPYAFAAQQYLDFLGRPGESAGINYWAALLQAGSVTRAQVVDSFFNSSEFQGNIAPLARLYFAYFDRIPDYAGLTYWIDQFRAGASLDAMSQAFADSDEFIATYGSLSNADFVDLVYQNVLGRLPDTQGRAYWVAQLAAGMSRGAMMIGFSESSEYQNRSNDWIQVTMMYIGMLRREPEIEGFDYWVEALSAGRSILELIEGFLESDEYAARFD